MTLPAWLMGLLFIIDAAVAIALLMAEPKNWPMIVIWIGYSFAQLGWVFLAVK